MVKRVVQVLLNSNTKYKIHRDKITIICCHSELLFLDIASCSLPSPKKKKTTATKNLLGAKMEGQETSQKCGKMQEILGAAIFCTL